MGSNTIAECLSRGKPGNKVELHGWVRTLRDQGSFCFVKINDGSCLAELQIVAESSLENFESEIKRLSPGCSIHVAGELKASPGKGQSIEVHAAEIGIYGWADPETYRLQKKRHSFEQLREWAHLRPRTNTFGAIARVRNQICCSIHSFFQEHGFLYTQTPVITSSDAEGAGEMFRVTTLKPEDVPKTQSGEVDYTHDFFKRPTFLTVSGQLQAEIFACSLGKVYTFGPTFRAENSHTSRHLAEFWMVEPEMAFYDLTDNMDLAERFIKRIAGDALDKCDEDLQFFNQRIDNTVLENLTGIVEKDFQRIPHSQAVEILLKSGETFENEVNADELLQSDHECYLTEKHFKKPLIVYDYPRKHKPFYMYVNADERTVRAMDVLVPNVGEIIGGSQREHRLEMLEQRLAECNMQAADYDWYLDLRRYGTVPHSGFGLGLERLVQFVTGMSNIRDVIPFPRTPGHAEF